MARHQAEPSGQVAGTKRKNRSLNEREVDDQIEDSFPASDPPSYAGGSHRAGAPKEPKKAPKRGR
jgi:hypothetical protein